MSNWEYNNDVDRDLKEVFYKHTKDIRAELDRANTYSRLVETLNKETLAKLDEIGKLVGLDKLYIEMPWRYGKSNNADEYLLNIHDTFKNLTKAIKKKLGSGDPVSPDKKLIITGPSEYGHQMMTVIDSKTMDDIDFIYAANMNSDLKDSFNDTIYAEKMKNGSEVNWNDVSDQEISKWIETNIVNNPDVDLYEYSKFIESIYDTGRDTGRETLWV